MNAPALSGDVIARAAALQRRAARPQASAWVRASAGSGKTKVLSDRVLNLLLAGVAPERILCLTFTRAAAAEMQARITLRLGTWTTAADAGLDADLQQLSGTAPDAGLRRRARRLFVRVLDSPGGLRIMTIHAFCQSVLARFPLEGGVAPHFRVLDDRDAADLQRAAVAAVLESAERGDAALAPVIADLTRHVHELHFDDLVALLLRERGRFVRLIRAAGGVDGLVARIRAYLDVAEGTTAEGLLAAGCAEEAFDRAGLARSAEVLYAFDRDRKRMSALIAGWLDRDREGRMATFDDYALAYLTQTGSVRKRGFGHGLTREYPEVVRALHAEIGRVVHLNERRAAARLATATAAMVRFSHALERTYAGRKEARAQLDFDDLILGTRALLSGSENVAWALYKLDGGIDHILVDEAQDTNADQWAVVARLSDDFFSGRGAGDDGRPVPRSVFAVGDVKQSIYSFQGADPAAFATMRDVFAGQVQAAGGAWDDVELDVSFRSTAPVLQAVDAVFNRSQAADGVVDGDIAHLVSRGGMAGTVELWPVLPAVRAPETPPWQPPVERVTVASAATRLARLVAGRIRAWLDDGEMLPARGRPMTAGDVMVLVRRRGPFVDDLVRALKGLDVPVAGVDRMVLSEQLAVMDMAALGRLLLLPTDDLTLATVLKSPLVGLDEASLFALAHGREGRLWAELVRRRDETPEFAAAHGFLAPLLARADYLRPHELFAQILEQGGRARILARLGPDAADPLDEFLGAALDYERGHAASLEGFLAWLDAGGTEVKRDLERGAGAVRVMTVHGAKGLQAPVVILPDTRQVPRAPPRLLWPDDDDGQELVLWSPREALRESRSEEAIEAAKHARDQEYRRLLYVAMTRAEDRLLVCGWDTRHKPPPYNWYELVSDALVPITEEIEDPFLAGCGENLNAVVRRLEAPQTAPVADGRGAPAAAAPGLPAWARAPAPEEAAAPRSLAPSRQQEEPPVMAPLDDPQRFRRGILVHRLLELLPEVAPGDRADACARFLERPAHGLDAAARAALAAEVLAVLGAPDLAALFAPGSAAEVPLAGVVAGADGRPVAISGQVDRLAVTPDSVLVVDYKTGRNPPPTAAGAAPAYLAQMAAYRALLREIYPHKPVVCALLWTDGPTLMRLGDEVLDRHLPAAAGGA